MVSAANRMGYNKKGLQNKHMELVLVLFLIFGFFVYNFFLPVIMWFVQVISRRSKISKISSSKDFKALAKPGRCELCGREGVKVAYCKIADYASDSSYIGTRYRNACARCMADKKAELVEKQDDTNSGQQETTP